MVRGVVFYGVLLSREMVQGDWEPWELEEQLGRHHVSEQTFTERKFGQSVGRRIVGVEALSYGSYDNYDHALVITDSVQEINVDDRVRAKPVPTGTDVVGDGWVGAIFDVARELGINLDGEPGWFFSAVVS